MIVLYKWLQEYVDFSIPPRELADKLTATGPEVVSIKPVGISAENTGRIVLTKAAEVEKHPKADNLKLVRVNGPQGAVTVITNSPAIEKGQFVVYAAPGVKLPNGVEVKEAVLKGETSQGMLLAKEQLHLEEKSADIWLLGKNEKEARRVFDIYAVEDYVMEVELTANRSDCLSVIGIAREISAMLDKELKLPKPRITENLDMTPDITIEDKSRCPRYASRVMKGVQVRPSDESIRRRLELCGIRAINNIVDATNYVLLEAGQPQHAFDYKLLQGNKIIVRTAGKGEKMTTLDGKEHALTPEMLVIADEKRAVALAGVMGGQNSEIGDGTTDILLESAFFDPITIRKTAKALGIRTEASYRFERTADWGISAAALDRLCEIILRSCPEAQVSKMNDAYVNIFKDRVVNVRADFISGRLGVEFSLRDIEGYMKRLRFPVVARREDTLEVKIPSYRSDIDRAIDVAEEIARIYGYNNIPENRFKPTIDPETLNTGMDIAEKVRETLTVLGFTEVYNYSFTSREDLEALRAWEDRVSALTNPLSADASVLRNYLFPGMARNAAHNVQAAYKNEVRLFELGRVFAHNNGKTGETRTVGLLSYGGSASYQGLLAVLENLASRVMMKPLSYGRFSRPFLHPVNAAAVMFNGREIGFIGELHPAVVKKLDLKGGVFTAEIERAALEEAFGTKIEAKPFGRFPPTSRDLSLVVKEDVMARDLENTLSAASPLVRSVGFVDLFKGVQVGEGRKSLTFTIQFQAMDRTLTDQEVNDITAGMVKTLEKEYGAELRG